MHVMESLDRLEHSVEKLDGKIDCVDKKVSNLRVEVAQKGAIWGAVTGGLMALTGWVLRR